MSWKQISKLFQIAPIAVWVLFPFCCLAKHHLFSRYVYRGFGAIVKNSTFLEWFNSHHDPFSTLKMGGSEDMICCPLILARNIQRILTLITCKTACMSSIQVNKIVGRWWCYHKQNHRPHPHCSVRCCHTNGSCLHTALSDIWPVFMFNKDLLHHCLKVNILKLIIIWKMFNWFWLICFFCLSPPFLRKVGNTTPP